MDLKEVLCQRLGWLIDSQATYAQLDPLVRQRQRELGLSSVDGYYRRVGEDSVELQVLAEELSVRETWFYRELEPLKALLQSLRESGKAPPYRVLSLPCASGEEPYSLLMLAEESGWSRQDLEIDGIDLSYRAIAQARHGHYRNYSFRAPHFPDRNRFFQAAGGEWRIDPGLTQRIYFSVGNLLELGPRLSESSFDAILCRNLLIYFSLEARQKALRTFRRLLTSKGLLVVAACEGSEVLQAGFYPSSTAALFGVEPLAGSLAPVPSRAPLEPTAEPRRLPPPRAEKVPSSVPPPVPPALASLEQARSLADRGLLQAAVEECKRVLQEKGPSSETYALLGVSLGALNQLEEAEIHLRKAIYLEPQHRESLTHLVLTLQRQGKHSEAARWKGRAERAQSREG